MSRPDVDEVLNYLSIKFNKIFCDRDFVCCVSEDFRTVLENKKKICVLVFPTLGPIYLKALRYQARIFDLAVFNITSASGKFKSLAVCHKDHLKKSQVKEDTMPESSLSKRKRPERQLYVPPAQRVSRLASKQCDKRVTSELVKHPQVCEKIKNKSIPSEETNEKCSSASESVLNLSDIANLAYFINSLPCNFQRLPQNCYQHGNCEFKKFLYFKQFDTSLMYDRFIKIYDNFQWLSNVCWEINNLRYSQNARRHFKSYPMFDLDDFQTETERPCAVLVSCEVNDFNESVAELHEFENSLYRIECDKICDESGDLKLIDLAVLGHFFIVTVEESDYLYECQEKHDASVCCANVKKQIEISRQVDKLNVCAINNENETQPNKPTHKNLDKNGTTVISKNDKEKVRNQINQSRKKIPDDKHEQEKEIMRMTKEYINRKNRPIMKYVDDSKDPLQIGNSDSVNNWEDLFDDNGAIQEQLLTEIVDKVGDDVTIMTANEDYTPYSNKPPENLEHIVELYNFPATLETHDLVQAFSDINSDAMYIKWVDDTHALLVLGSLSQAEKAINMRNPMIKVRPMTSASAISVDVANKSDLKPAMKRPPTNLQTARRLITTHLGTKSKLTKEQIAKEKQDLKTAREMKRLLRQNEKDAWEGSLRSSIN
jgi:hypothetical protein